MKTTLRLAPLALLIGCASPSAFASFDFVCSPTWAIAGDQLMGCSNLPFLSPGNDSRANLQLLLADAGRLRLPETLKSTSGYEDGYAQVPFTLEMLDPANAEAAASENGGESAEGEAGDAEAEQKDLRRRTSPWRSSNWAWSWARPTWPSTTSPKAKAIAAAATTSTAPMPSSTNWPAPRRFRPASARRWPTAASTCSPSAARATRNPKTCCPPGPCSPPRRPGLRQLPGRCRRVLPGRLRRRPSAVHRPRQQRAALAQETALYMQARVELNQAQQDAFDEYGIPDLAKIDRNAMASAESGLKAYLQAYPEGLYHASARGLLRKVYWLLDDPRKFAAEYAWQFAQDEDSAQRNMSGRALIEELDVKLLPALKPEDVQDPTLLAVMDLIRLRKPGSELSPSISLEQLQAQKQRFASQPGLHDYLVAAWHFCGGDAAKALAALPAGDTQAPMGLLVFSQETLRGLALEATGKPDAARELWLQLLSRQPSALQRGQLELALALNLSRTGKVAEIFAADSPIRTAPIREIVLRNLASADLLRQQAKDGAAPRRA